MKKDLSKCNKSDKMLVLLFSLVSFKDEAGHERLEEGWKCQSGIIKGTGVQVMCSGSNVRRSD